jgi:hypothetical protein
MGSTIVNLIQSKYGNLSSSVYLARIQILLHCVILVWVALISHQYAYDNPKDSWNDMFQIPSNLLADQRREFQIISYNDYIHVSSYEQ